MANEMPYIVINPDGVTVLQSLVRHPRRVELDLLEHGYTIKLHGKKQMKRITTALSWMRRLLKRMVPIYMILS